MAKPNKGGIPHWWDADAFARQMMSHALQRRCRQIRRDRSRRRRELAPGRQHLAARLHGSRWRRAVVTVAAGEHPDVGPVDLTPELLRVLTVAMDGDADLQQLADTLGLSEADTLDSLAAAEAAVLGALA